MAGIKSVSEVINFRQRAGYVKGFVVLFVVIQNEERRTKWLNL